MINRSRIKPWGFALATATFMFASQQAMALSVSANGGDESFGVEASQTIFPTLRAGVGYLNTDDSGHNAKAYSGSLMFTPWLPGIDLSVGGRYQYQDTHYGNGGGLGLGGSAFVDTPIPLTSIGGYGFYTPEGLAHGDIDKSYEYGAQARVTFSVQNGTALRESTHATIRYRNLVGQRYIALTEDVGSTAELDPGDTIPMEQTTPALDLTLLFNGFQPLFEALSPDAYSRIRAQEAAADSSDAEEDTREESEVEGTEEEDAFSELPTLRLRYRAQSDFSRNASKSRSVPVATTSAVYSGCSKDTMTWLCAARLYTSSGCTRSSTRRRPVPSARSA